MTKPKNPEPNPIEKAIGERAKDLKAQEKFTKEYQTEPTPETGSPPTLRDVPDQPLTQSETVTLEELNRRTEERLQDQYPEKPTNPQPTTERTAKQVLAETIPVPVLKSDRLPVTKTSSLESPPQGTVDSVMATRKIETEHTSPQVVEKEFSEMAFQAPIVNNPAEDIELTALRKYILEDGFVVATVAFHIVSLCAQPMMTPSTTMWDFRDRASIPDMVLALLNQSGYLEGIWPSLRIVMGSNKGNTAWCAGIATTIAFFDVVRTLPAIKELQNESEKKS